MKPITTSVYTFKDFIGGGFLYIDKTAAVRELIRPAKSQYFLSRPRRFGKSLLVSTLKAVFQGRRDLFEGLALGGADYDWPVHPVIHLDLGSAAAETAEGITDQLLHILDRNAKEYGLTLSRPNAPGRFLELVEALYDRQGPVVVLVDEYDKPLLGHLGKPSVLPIQSLLKQFYSVIKTTEPLQRFALITGVSKFAKVSIFSDLNNLTDLTMEAHSATLLGYTQDELEAGFPDYIARLADSLGKTREDALKELRVWYNGYKFEEDAPTVYNPVSLMKCFMNEKFKNYWFETGTPTFLLELLKDNPVDLNNLNVDENAFSTYDPIDLHPLPLLFQTGYLTLKGSEMLGDTRYYTLGYPNHEISQSFSYWLVRSMASVPDPELSGALRYMVKALQAGDIDTMLEHLKTFFHTVQYDLIEEKQKEKYYQTIFFTVFKLVGAMIDAEVRTSRGRIDAVIKTAGHICIFEFKLKGSADDAMAQIKDKQYAAGYRDDPRQVILVGVAFDWEARNLGAWRIEPAFPNASPGEDNSKQVRERSPSYGLSEQEARVLSRAVQDYANACKGLEQAEANRQSFATKMIAEWAPFIERVWQSWTPAPHEVCAMLYLEEYPPSAFRHVVEDCINRSLRTEEVVGTRTYFRTELNGNPAENERAIFPVPLDVVHRLTSLIDIRWIDRNPGAQGTVPESS